jgi:hypothetical protein
MDNKRTQPGIGFVIAIVACAIMAVGSITGYIYFRTTPYYSLHRLKQAIIKRDAPEVLKYLDTDSIIDHMAKDVVAQMDKKRPPRNRFDEKMQGAGKDIIAQLVPQLKKQIGDSLTALLESYDDDKLFANLRRATVFGLAIDVKDDGTAEVRERGKTEVSFTMRKAPEGHWRINWINSDQFQMIK